MDTKAYIGLVAWDMGFDAHMTLHFIGELDKERADYVLHTLKELGPITSLALRTTLDCFGSAGAPVPVVKLVVSQDLVDYRSMLSQAGIINDTDSQWKPHITLKIPDPTHATIHIPQSIKLTGPYLRYDGKRIKPFTF